MTAPGNREITAEELPELLKGELPSTLPLEGWRTVTLHCQVDGLGPSERHPDLVKLEVSFPPEKPPAPPCRRCRGRGVIPDLTQWEQKPVPCPECTGEVTTCSATMLHAMAGRVSCGRPAGHYDPSLMPVRDQPGGWHQSEPDRDGTRFIWNDMYDAATPHGADPFEPRRAAAAAARQAHVPDVRADDSGGPPPSSEDVAVRELQGAPGARPPRGGHPVKGIYHLVSLETLDDARPYLRWSESHAMRTDETAWMEVWKRVHPARVKAGLDQVVPLVAWTPWPEELALQWLGLEPSETTPALPENVLILLEKARPLLVRRH
jgi:hypothetical protein